MNRLARRILVSVASSGAMAAAVSPAANALTINVLAGNGRSTVYQDYHPVVNQVVAFASPPFSSGPVTASDAGNVATTTFTFTNSLLLFEFDHERIGADIRTNSTAASDEVNHLVFQVSEAVTVVLSGSYSVLDTGSGDAVNYTVSLKGPGDVNLHTTDLQSQFTLDESFTLGVNGGDTTDSVSGATTQLLMPGQNYTLDWVVYVQDRRSDIGDLGATGSGYFQLAFIPEPSTGLLLAYGLAMLSMRRRRRKP